MRARRGIYRIRVCKTEGRNPLGRHRRRWEDNFKMDLREMEYFTSSRVRDILI
jgi:hypothetical protein